MQPPVQWWPLVALLVLLACPCIIARNRFSTGPSIKYVGTFFTISDTPFPMSALFYTYSSSIFPQSLTPPPPTIADVLYERPSRRAPRKEGSLCSFAQHYCTALHCTQVCVCTRLVKNLCFSCRRRRVGSSPPPPCVPRRHNPQAPLSWKVCLIAS